MRTKDQRIRALGAVPLLSGLSRSDLSRVLNLGKDVEFIRGAVIVKAGDVARDFYMVLQGRGLLTVPGRRSVRLGPGDAFGEISVLDGGRRSATIVAQTRVFALRIDRAPFLGLLDMHGSIGRKILVEMARRVRAAEGTAGRH